ncbi:MAG: hypothetical protein E7365_02195 [Clostridiales bacterium]|nr:hypothetical protein [Clostridiales bacterium]
MKSVWEQTTQKINFKTLNGNKNTDVLIIGGGIAGILCAYQLKNKKIKNRLIKTCFLCFIMVNPLKNCQFYDILTV